MWGGSEMRGQENNNFIMSYPFNQKQAGYSVPPNFTPWSQSVGGLLGGNSPGLPFAPYTPFSFPHPFLIHQQNNFYNSNFTIPPSFSALHHPLSKPQRPPTPFRKPIPLNRTLQSSEVIIISDDEDQSYAAKNLMAVVREKNEPKQVRLQPVKGLQRANNEKEGLEIRRPAEHRDTLERKDSKIKKSVKSEAKEEAGKDELLAKKKKINKERSGFRLSEHLKQLMQVSRYREYRPDLIMVGPQFQAAIEDGQLYQERQAWLQARREDLQQRRHE